MNYLLIGKPNVGKTSIYNILTGFDSNITHAKVGTTRDWHFEKLRIHQLTYMTLLAF